MARWDVHSAARKHGVPDADIVLAIAPYRYVAALEEKDPWRTLYLGPDTAGNLLEIVVVERDDGTRLAIHAMKMRKTFEQLLQAPEGNL